MKFLNPLLMALSLMISVHSYAQFYQIDSVYKAQFTYLLELQFDSANSVFETTNCRELWIEMRPGTPKNDNVYKLYDGEGNYLMSTIGSFRFVGVPGNQEIVVVKDGDSTIFTLKQNYLDYTERYNSVLTDADFNEIENFDPEYLNSIELKGGIKNLTTMEVDSCVPWFNWTLNDNWVSNINEVILKNKDTLCIGIDGISDCTEGCMDYHNNCYILKDVITSLEENGKDKAFIFPPVASSEIQIFSNAEFGKYKILNSNGLLLKSGKYLNDRIDVSSLKAGVYILIAESDKEYFMGRFIKQ